MRGGVLFFPAIALAAGIAASATGASGGGLSATRGLRLRVVPKAPIVGERSRIELRGRVRSPLYATVSSAVVSGVGKVRLRHVGPRLWRGFYVFGVGGAWTVQAHGVSRSIVAHLPAAATFTPPGGPGCAPPSPANKGSLEVRGSGGLWALMGVSVPHEAIVDGLLGKQTKIVWRLGGGGDLSLVAIAPDGTGLAPDWLDPHLRGSTWTRPGDEWGSGFTFTQTGCWDIHAVRQGASGDVWLLVRS